MQNLSNNNQNHLPKFRFNPSESLPIQSYHYKPQKTKTRSQMKKGNLYRKRAAFKKIFRKLVKRRKSGGNQTDGKLMT